MRSIIRPAVALPVFAGAAGRVSAARAGKLDSAQTVEGQSLHIGHANGGVQIDRANVVKADVDASNGVIDVIDTVVSPT